MPLDPAPNLVHHRFSHMTSHGVGGGSPKQSCKTQAAKKSVAYKLVPEATDYGQAVMYTTDETVVGNLPPGSNCNALWI